MKRIPPFALLLTLAVATSFAQTQPATNNSTAPDPGGPDAVWRNRSKSADARARDLLARLTQAEKVSLLHADGTFTTPGLPRFSIPKLWMSDGPQGVREEIQPSGWNNANRTDDFATALPAGVGLAATFDVNLAKAFGNVIGEEAVTRHKNIMLCPGLNIMRTPLNGRNSEYLGEDPYLAARMAVQFVQGIQSHGVSACAKHYALNNQENNRGSVNVHVDERTMREIYLPAFKAAVTEGHVWSVMAAYNRVNGQYCSENDFLLNQVLKKDWNFQGLVMTDWGGAHSTVNAARNGLDTEMGTNVTGNHNNDFFATPLLNAIGTGENQVPQSRIDDMALRNLRVMAETGLLNTLASPLGDPAPAVALMAQPHLDTARQIAESAMVLLKNSADLLPIDQAKFKSIAVIGDNAKAQFAHDGNSAAIKTSREVTPYQGIANRINNDLSLTYAQGYARPAGGGRGRGAASAPNPQLLEDAVNAARNADIAIVIAGLYRAQDQEGADRPSFELPPGQSDLIAAVCKANPRTIVVLTGGSPSNVSPWLGDAGALMMYWYGGSEGGTALARVLFGDVCPAGHLPCSWPKQLADSPAHHPADPAIFPGTGGGRGAGAGRGMTPETGPQENYAEGIFVGYRWFDAQNIEPQFPFGFGLTYTTFAFSDLNVLPTRGSNQGQAPSLSDRVLQISATLTNTGTRDAADIVQVYVEQTKPSLPRPPRELKGFTKIGVTKDAHATANISLPLSAFAYFDPEKHAWVAEAGEYTLLVGDSSRNLPLKTKFSLDRTITIKEGP